MLLITVLPGLHPVLDLHGKLAALLLGLKTAVDELALPADGADRAHDSGGTRAESLNETALVGRFGKLLHRVLALLNLPALRLQPLTSQREDGVTRDALEDGAVEGSGDEGLLTGLLVLESNEEVHGADLGDVLLLAEKPQVLLETAAHGLDLGHDAGRVVGAELLVTDTAGPGAHGVVGRLERDGLEARGVVRADGGGDDVEQSRTGGTDAEGLLRADHGRAKVQRVAALLGDEATVELDQLGDQVDQGGRVESGKGDAGGRLVEARHVLVGAEEADLAGLVLVRLHALETLESVVEDAGGGVEREVLVRLDLGRVPAILFGPFDGEHMVCWLEGLLVKSCFAYSSVWRQGDVTSEVAAKDELLGLKKGLGLGALLDLELGRVHIGSAGGGAVLAGSGGGEGTEAWPRGLEGRSPAEGGAEHVGDVLVLVFWSSLGINGWKQHNSSLNKKGLKWISWGGKEKKADE